MELRAATILPTIIVVLKGGQTRKHCFVKENRFLHS